MEDFKLLFYKEGIRDWLKIWPHWRFGKSLTTNLLQYLVQYTMGHYHHVRKFIVRNRNLQLPHQCRRGKNICKVVDIGTISENVMNWAIICELSTKISNFYNFFGCCICEESHLKWHGAVLFLQDLSFYAKACCTLTADWQLVKVDYTNSFQSMFKYIKDGTVESVILWFQNYFAPKILDIKMCY